MATTFQFCEYNGAPVWAGTGYVGTTLTTGITTCNWKNIEGADSTYYYRTYPITAGRNSYTRYVFGKFDGTYNTIQNGLWAHTAGDFGDPGITLTGLVTNDYSEPDTTGFGGVNMTAPIAITSGQTVFFGQGSTAGGNSTSVSAGSGTGSAYTCFLKTYLATTTAARAGDTTQITLTLRYDEN